MDKDDIELINGSDLRDPTLVKAFIEARKENHQPIPPGNHIRFAGHHWLHHQPHLTGSADQGNMIVAQWSPTELRWYHSNDLASVAKPLYGDGLMTYWKWVGHVPLPDL